MSTPEERREIYSSRRWRHLRMAAIRRDLARCAQCGRAHADLEVHHKKPVREGGPIWDLDNLECLCKRCHRGEHRPPGTPEQQAWSALVARELEAI